MAMTSRRTRPNALPTRVANRDQRSPGRRASASKPAGSAGEACDSIPEERGGDEDQEHVGDRHGVSLEPGSRAGEAAAGPLRRNDQEQEGHRERQQRDEREEEPLDRGGDACRVGFGDVLQRARGEGNGGGGGRA